MDYILFRAQFNSLLLIIYQKLVSNSFKPHADGKPVVQCVSVADRFTMTSHSDGLMICVLENENYIHRAYICSCVLESIFVILFIFNPRRPLAGSLVAYNIMAAERVIVLPANSNCTNIVVEQSDAVAFISSVDSITDFNIF